MKALTEPSPGTAGSGTLIARAGSVILAAAGFGANPESVERYIPELAGAPYFGAPYATGDAIAWGQSLGAAVDHMGAYQSHSSIAYPKSMLVTTYLINHGAIQVNRHGYRFGDETDAYAGHALAVQAQPGRFVLLSVTDNGLGMDQNTMDQIFDPFFTTKGVGKGTGLGLSTVYGIVKQNSGLLHVYSELDHGTTFKIYLPLVERPAQDVGNKIVVQVRGGDETILLAEDDPGVLGLGTRILEDAGYKVLTAEDGELALKVFMANIDTLDMALLDVVMPKMGGREVENEIHRFRPDFKVVFASGYSENAIHVDFVLDEGNILIQKPYRRDDLLSKIRQVLNS